MGTSREVAERAGVSTSTVSHVLNNTRWVSPDLRERVLSAMRDLGYEPNAVARSLKIKRSNALGLVISDIGSPFFTSVVRGVEDVAQESGYTIILGNSDEDPAKEAAYLRILAAGRVDGLILVPAGVRHDYLVRLARAHFPLVFLDREVPDLPMTSVTLQNEMAAREAVRHLIRLGHRRIAMVAGPPLITSTIDRIAGYRHALEEARIPVDDRLIACGGWRTEPARIVSEAVLDLDPRPTAFFAANYPMTVGAAAAIQGRGLAIPRDMALVGFDDFAWADVFRPRLTTVAQPTYELGRTAAELLLARIAGEPESPPERVVLSGRLVIRESCGTRRRRTARVEPTVRREATG